MPNEHELARIPGSKRTRFSPGSPLLAEDLELAHDYLAEKIRQHNRLAFAVGVIRGLAVTCTDRIVHISEGAAMDADGRILELSEAVSLTLPETSGQWQLMMTIEEVETDPWEELYAGFDQSPTEVSRDPVYRHLQEELRVYLAPDHAADAAGVSLARLVISDQRASVEIR